MQSSSNKFKYLPKRCTKTKFCCVQSNKFTYIYGFNHNYTHILNNLKHKYYCKKSNGINYRQGRKFLYIKGKKYILYILLLTKKYIYLKKIYIFFHIHIWLLLVVCVFMPLKYVLEIKSSLLVFPHVNVFYLNWWLHYSDFHV